MQSERLAGSNYGYSGTRVEDLGASEYTLVTIVLDQSGSVHGYADEMDACVKAIVETLRKHPRADNLMIRVVRFDSNMDEFHGYKLLMDCNPSDYDGVTQPGGLTALFDACYNAFAAANTYGRKLLDEEYEVNGLVFVVTDGMDNQSSMTPAQVAKQLSDAVAGENMESMLSILVGVDHEGNPHVEQGLADFTKEAGFDQYEVLKNADADGLARVANLASQSISSQSQSLGSGGPSQTLTF
jgi:uncharacterized protein YegL